MNEITVMHRIYYYETDQMKRVYHSNYAKWFEIGRTEYFRKYYSYKDLEELGIFLPIKNIEIEYLYPVFYDDIIKIKVILKELTKIKIIFNYEIYNEDETKLLARGSTCNVFVNDKGEIFKIEEKILNKLRGVFNE